jgi:hypothetical protein
MRQVLNLNTSKRTMELEMTGVGEGIGCEEIGTGAGSEEEWV